ncbi:MAG TPA: helix-turn-helix domain-containing protein, partial [Aliicoccus persicus]|nr:helix-turn-helix domain-containing protein [Aliicoccus persicus]
MARHRSFEEKIQIVDYYLSHGDLEGTAEKFEVGASTLQDWARKYLNHGEESLFVRTQHMSYSSDFKQMVAHEYLQGDDSYQTLALKYNIPAGTTVRKWVL